MIRTLRAFAVVGLVTGIGLVRLSGAVDAQPPAALPRIGVLLVVSSTEGPEAQAFREALRDQGYAEGRDVMIEWRSANSDYAKVPALVAELVQRKVDVIVVESTVAAQAAKRATSAMAA